MPWVHLMSLPFPVRQKPKKTLLSTAQQNWHEHGHLYRQGWRRSELEGAGGTGVRTCTALQPMSGARGPQ